MPFSLRFLRFSAALAATAALTGCPGKSDEAKNKPPVQPPIPVITGVAVKKDMPLDLRAIGTVEAIAKIGVQAQVSGELIGMHFEEGQEVKKGQLLFSIQPRLYATRLAEAEANLARDKATATNAQLALSRQEELDRKGAGIKEELERSRAAAEAANAVVKADEALVLIAQTQVGYTTIESPIDGRTGAVSTRPGTLIKVADEPMTTVVQLAPIYVSFTIPEQHLAAIRAGVEQRKMQVTALEPRTGKPLGTGDLTFISNLVDTTTGTIALKGTFPNADRALWPGAFVDVMLQLDTEKGVTVVPSPAITLGQKGSQVWVAKQGGDVELRVVKTGRTVAQETIVLSGLQEGERVVTTGQNRLLPSSKIVEKQPEKPADKPAEAPAGKATAETAKGGQS